MTRGPDTLPPLDAPATAGDATLLDAAPVASVHDATTLALGPVSPASASPARAPTPPARVAAPAAPPAPAARPAPAPPPDPRPPSPVPAPVAAAAPVPAAPPRERAGPHGFPPLPVPTPASPPRRVLPRRARLALAGAGALIVLVVAAGQRGRRDDPAPTLRVHDELVVSEDDLRKRKEVRPEDFGTGRGARLRVAPRPSAAAPPASAPAAVSEEELAARHARRAGDDPEDLLARRAAVRRGETTAAAPPADSGPRRALYLAPAAAPAPATPPEAPGLAGEPRALAGAGSTLQAVLDTPVVLKSGSTTVAAHVEGGTLDGARLIGTATLGQGRVTVRFRTLVLPSGEELDFRGEALGGDGGFGLPVEDTGSDDGPSVEREIGEDTATDLAAGAIGGLGGRAVTRYVRGKRKGGGPKVSPTIRIESGEVVEVFVHEAVRVED